jgi:hypothetical protein
VCSLRSHLYHSLAAWLQPLAGFLHGQTVDIVPYLTTAQIDTILQGLTLVAGALAAVVGFRRYSKAQAWKRHEFVAAEIREFESMSLTRNAMLMIDWGTRNVELYPSHPDYNSRFELVTRPLLYSALITHDKIGRPYTVPESAIRDCFDAFFGGLERFEQFMEAGLVSEGEFRPYLAYWIRSICEEASPELRRLLNNYVAFYHFDGVASLFRRYDRNFGLSDASQPVLPRAQIQDTYEARVQSELAAQSAPFNTR